MAGTAGDLELPTRAYGNRSFHAAGSPAPPSATQAAVVGGKRRRPIGNTGGGNARLAGKDDQSGRSRGGRPSAHGLRTCRLDGRSRRAAWKMGDQSTEGMLRAAMGTTRASIRFWQVNRTLTWLAGLALCVFVLARMSWGALQIPPALVYSPLLIVPLCIASDMLMRSRLRQLASRLEGLQRMVVDLHT